jgi:hypothetical protein
MRLIINKTTQNLLFEENYLCRSLGSLVHRPDIALTELAANAWDAGASRVDITIPDRRGEKIVIQDDGAGLTEAEFYARWMTLGYNRKAHQGDGASFPLGLEGKRLSYGRNGVGRHSLLCFNNFYDVITSKNGTQCSFGISALNKGQPFLIDKISRNRAEEHGTRLEVKAERNLPSSENISKIISSRFLHDPQFRVSINGNCFKLEEHSGLISAAELAVNENIKLSVLLIDTQQAASSSIYQGIAFWNRSRLIGEPSWILGSNSVIDGRTKFAKRYTFIVKTDDLDEYITDYWSPVIDGRFCPKIDGRFCPKLTVNLVQ